MAIMLWNVFGWAGMQLTINEIHHKDELHYCSKSLCYCEVQEADQICTCHHHDEQNDSSTNHGNPENRFCFYQATHNVPLATSLALITYQFQAYLAPDFHLARAFNEFDFPVKDTQAYPQEFYPSLLRPPIVGFS